jgi:hypothetical protein
MTARQFHSPAHNFGKLAALGIRIHGGDDFTANRHPRGSGPDELRLLRVRLAADAGIPRVIVGEQNRMAQRRRLPIRRTPARLSARQSVRQPERFRSARSKAGEADILQLISRQTVLIKMWKHGIAPRINADPTGKAIKREGEQGG